MISIDFTNMMSTAVDNGITEAGWHDASAQFAGAHAAVQALHAAGTIGFGDLPKNTALLQQSLDFAARTRGKYDDVVLLGIGGSALGPMALRTALCAHDWNQRSMHERGGYPRLHVLDNVDPVSVSSVLSRVNVARTLYIVTSKSGGTAETMSQFLIVHNQLRQSGASIPEHLVFITDPSHGALRSLAAELCVPTLDIPPNIGGRFSVLTPVGTLPAALLGVDVRALLEGAGAMATQCESPDLMKNPAGVYAALQYVADTRHGRVINALMPYADPLRDFAAWYVQLWAESLGKTRPDGTYVGGTPLPALGATDQHSQVQLFMEGPPNKVITFIAVTHHAADVTIPRSFGDVTELAYLGGHSLAELINVEQRATAGALAKRGRTNMTIQVDRVDAWHVGGLMMLFELATAYAGQLYGVDAFNQPGVELGKQFAYALLGRPGADAAKAEWDTLPIPDARWRIGG
jgi:glucose-6-phosphate isomerase